MIAKPKLKPLMMMRTRGIQGPSFRKNANCKKLSKSVGDAVSKGIIS